MWKMWKKIKMVWKLLKAVWNKEKRLFLKLKKINGNDQSMSDLKYSDSSHDLECIQNDLEQDSLSNDEKNSIFNNGGIGDEDIIDEDMHISLMNLMMMHHRISIQFFWKRMTKKTKQMKLFMPSNGINVDKDPMGVEWLR